MIAALRSSVLATLVAAAAWPGLSAAQAPSEADPDAGVPQPTPSVEDELRARLADQEARLKRLEQAPPAPATAAPTLLQKLKLSGDVGYRFEYMRNVAHLSTEHTYRNRYRLRLAGKFEPAPEWEVGFRIANADPRYPSTGWETFGQSPSPGEVAGPEAGSGRSAFVNFDRAYVNWRPFTWAQLQLGKQEMPIWKPWAVWRSSVWHDDDVQPAGTAEIFTLPHGGRLKSLKVVAGQYLLEQLFVASSGRRGAMLFVNQLSGVVGLGDRVDVSWGVGFNLFDDVDRFARGTPQAMTAGTYRNRATNVALRSPTNDATHGGPADETNSLNCSPFSSGSNTLPACARYNSKFQVGNAALEVLVRLPLPLRLTFDAAYNFGAVPYQPGAEAPALAWLAHASLGDFKKAGEFQVGAGFYWGQADATWGVYADDDYLNTNVRTLMFNLKWRVLQDVLLVWDNYARTWISPNLAVMQGIVPDTVTGNAVFLSSRVTIVASF
ncbi:MAG: putative porin [Deltaproteobacteria bacterium]|nr:putative porin [Deltaproteobacteria bacterium]